MGCVIGNECDRTWDCHFHEYRVADLKWISRFYYHTNIRTWKAHQCLLELVHKIWAGDLNYVWCHMLIVLMSYSMFYVVYRHRLFSLSFNLSLSFTNSLHPLRFCIHTLPYTLIMPENYHSQIFNFTVNFSGNISVNFCQHTWVVALGHGFGSVGRIHLKYDSWNSLREYPPTHQSEN